MAIIEPNVLELLKHTDTRYTLVVESSQRARELVDGAEPMFNNTGMKPLKTAVEEINRGLLTYERPEEKEE